MNPIKFAIIGCGRISKRHCEIIGSNLLPGTILAAVCDIDLSKAKQCGEKFNAPFFNNYDEMLSCVECDFIVILTPSGLHAKHTIDVSKYGKHIIVEKPMALDISDADKMIEACDRNHIKLFVIKQNRFNLPIIKLKEAIDQNRFGKLVMGTTRVRWRRDQSYYDQDPWRGTWKYDGGVLTNQASHHIDLLLWLMGDVESVYAQARTALVNIETEDTAIVVLNFKSGALGCIEATTATRPEDLEGSISILGETGSVVVGGLAVNKIETWKFEIKTEGDNDINNFSTNPPNVYGFGHLSYYKSVINNIQNNGRHLIDGLEGRKSLELINAIYESIETDSKIYLHHRPRHRKFSSA